MASTQPGGWQPKSWVPSSDHRVCTSHSQSHATSSSYWCVRTKTSRCLAYCWETHPLVLSHQSQPSPAQSHRIAYTCMHTPHLLFQKDTCHKFKHKCLTTLPTLTNIHKVPHHRWRTLLQRGHTSSFKLQCQLFEHVQLKDVTTGLKTFCRHRRCSQYGYAYIRTGHQMTPFIALGGHLDSWKLLHTQQSQSIYPTYWRRSPLNTQPSDRKPRIY